MNPNFKRLDDPSRKLNYDTLTYGKLLTLLHSNITWKIFKTRYPGEPEELSDQEKVTFNNVSIDGLLTALANKRQKRAMRVSPFNFIEYISQRQYSYKIFDDYIEVVISGKVYRYQKVANLPYYNTYECEEVGTCDLANGMNIKYGLEPKVVSSGIDSYKVNSLSLKHIYIFSQLLYIKNNEWHPVVPVNSMVNILPCFECDDIGSVGDKCVAFAKYTFPNLKIASGENVLAGDKLGHFMYTCMDNYTSGEQYRFCHELANALSTVKTKVKSKGTVSVSALLPESIRVDMVKNPDTSDLVEAKRVAYNATLCKLEKVQSHDVEKSTLQAANQYEVNARSVYTTPTASYVGVQVPNQVMENIRFRTDFSFFSVDDATDYVVLQGVNQNTFVDMVNKLLLSPGVRGSNGKLLVKIAIISSSVSTVDIEHNFLAYKSSIFVHTDLEIMLSNLSAKKVTKGDDEEVDINADIDEASYNTIRKRTVVIDLTEPKSLDIVSSSLVINKVAQDNRNKDYIGRVRKGMTYKSYIFYYPVISVSKGIELRLSSMPHSSYMIVICGYRDYKFPSWQRQISTSGDIVQYHKAALYANIARMHYFLTNKKVWDYVSLRVTGEQPKFEVPETYYRRVVKGSVSGVTVDELEAALDIVTEDDTDYKKLLEKDPAVVLAYAQAHAPAVFSTKVKPPLAVWLQAIIYFRFMYGKKGVKLSNDIDQDSLTACTGAVSLLQVYAPLPTDKSGNYSIQKLGAYFKLHLGNDYPIPENILDEDYKDIIYNLYLGHSKWITTSMTYVKYVIDQCKSFYDSRRLGGKKKAPSRVEVIPERDEEDYYSGGDGDEEIGEIDFDAIGT